MRVHATIGMINVGQRLPFRTDSGLTFVNLPVFNHEFVCRIRKLSNGGNNGVKQDLSVNRSF